MIWLLRDLDLLSVLLRALTLSLEALTLGGVAFLFFVAIPTRVNADQSSRTRRAISWFALALLFAQAAVIAVSVAVLMGSAQLPWASVVSAGFFLAGCVVMLGCLLLAGLVRLEGRKAYLSLVPAGVILAACVAQSHAAARLQDRPLLLLLTALHHLGTAGWVGAMLFLLLALREAPTFALARQMARAYSSLAIASVAALVVGGVGMAWFYVGSWQGLYGTSYGVLLLAKIWLLAMMLMLGASNYRLHRKGSSPLQSGHGKLDAPLGNRDASRGFLVVLRRFSEAELGLGFTAILAAASLTAQAPAIDLPHDQLSGHEIVQRMRWQAPRLTSPALAQLAPPSTMMAQAVVDSAYTGESSSDANDRAWSEYNHHWAGLILLCTAVLALAAGALPPGRWRGLASNWPLLFLGLAALIVLRADPEAWPLGPRSFWQSFAAPDVLEHRVYAGLVACFAFFEWGVAKERWHARWVAYAFPLLCALGGAALLTHAHGISNVKDETLAEMSHTGIAVLGASAGWARWLQLRLAGTRTARVAGLVWPLCLALVGLLLLDYRES